MCKFYMVDFWWGEFENNFNRSSKICPTNIWNPSDVWRWLIWTKRNVQWAEETWNKHCLSILWEWLMRPFFNKIGYHDDARFINYCGKLLNFIVTLIDFLSLQTKITIRSPLIFSEFWCSRNFEVCQCQFSQSNSILKEPIEFDVPKGEAFPDTTHWNSFASSSWSLRSFL